jgi:HEAT repeat protein
MRTWMKLSWLAVFALPACGHAMSPDEAVGALQDPNPRVRQHAADSLRAGNVVPGGAIPVLLQDLRTEQDPAVRGAIYITLGTSGAPEAKPVLDQAVAIAADPDSRRWASRALKAWMIQTGAVPANSAFPPGWPYGQPGYPPILVR